MSPNGRKGQSGVRFLSFRKPFRSKARPGRLRILQRVPVPSPQGAAKRWDSGFPNRQRRAVWQHPGDFSTDFPHFRELRHRVELMPGLELHVASTASVFVRRVAAEVAERYRASASG